MIKYLLTISTERRDRVGSNAVLLKWRAVNRTKLDLALQEFTLRQAFPRSFSIDKIAKSLWSYLQGKPATELEMHFITPVMLEIHKYELQHGIHIIYEGVKLDDIN